MTRATLQSVILILFLSFAIHLNSVSPTFALDKFCKAQENFSLAIHGGAVWGNTSHANKEGFIKQLLETGSRNLQNGQKSLAVVEDMIVAMENSGLFNAGKGSVANRAGEIEMDASIMDGRHLRAGSVASIRTLKNPVSAARTVMNDTPHVMMVGPAADQYLGILGVEKVDPSYFLYSEENYSDIALPDNLDIPLTNATASNLPDKFNGIWTGVIGGKLNHVVVFSNVTTEGADALVALGSSEDLGLSKPLTIKLKARFLNEFLIAENAAFRIAYGFGDTGKLEAIISVSDGGRATGSLRQNPEFVKSNGTVGAVALDRCGNLAAGTSTGGFNSKVPGRVGDSPIIGAGTYADNRSAAVSATGHGEYFIRHAVAHEIAARIRHGGETLIKAAYQVVLKELKNSGGQGGIIAIDKNGEVVMLYNTDGMVRGRVTNQLPPKIETYLSD